MADITLKDALKRGIAAQQSGNITLADQYYTAILKVDENNKHANHNMGILALSLNKADLAIPYFEKALQTDSSETQFWLSYVTALLQLKKVGKAKEIMAQAVSAELTDKERLLDFATKHEIADRIKRANESIVAEIKGLFEQKKYKDVVKKAKNILATYPNSPSILFFAGLSYARTGHHELAIKIYKNAISIDNQRADIYYNLGISLKEVGSLDEALTSYLAALKLKPNYIEVYNNIGVLYGAKNNADKAIEYYERALELDSQQSGILLNLGVAYRSINDMDKAIDCFKQCLKIDPNFSDAENALAECYYNDKQYDSAQFHFDKIIHPFASAKSLECRYLKGEFAAYDEKLLELSSNEPDNIRVAALSTFVAQQRAINNPYPFCKNPLDFISITNLSKYQDQVKPFLVEVLAELDEIDSTWEPIGKTTKAGYQSKSHLFAQPTGKLKVLSEIVSQELGAYRNKLKVSNDRIYSDWPKVEKLEAWYVKLMQNGHQDSHIHPAGWVSGVIYLKTIQKPTEHEGAIEFGLEGYKYKRIKENVPTSLYQPCDGDIVLFPSSLFHKTVPVLQNTERCVIAFDLVGSSLRKF